MQLSTFWCLRHLSALKSGNSAANSHYVSHQSNVCFLVRSQLHKSSHFFTSQQFLLLSFFHFAASQLFMIIHFVYRILASINLSLKNRFLLPNQQKCDASNALVILVDFSFIYGLTFFLLI